MAVKQTAGRDQLGQFAPKFAQLNDDVLFGEVWSREEKLSLRDRSLVTVVALMSQGLTDSSFQHHLMTAKANGITGEEIAEIITHAAFYAGCPKAWAAFRLAKDIWGAEEEAPARPGETNLTERGRMAREQAGIWLFAPAPDGRWGDRLAPSGPDGGRVSRRRRDLF